MNYRKSIEVIEIYRRLVIEDYRWWAENMYGHLEKLIRLKRVLNRKV